MSSTPPLTHPDEPPGTIYNRVFWIAYLANVALVAANVLTFCFTNFIELIGGNNAQTGWIVSVGAIGALASRLFLGQILDRYGIRLPWILSSILYSLGIAGMLFSSSVGSLIFFARIEYAVGLAGMFTCSIVHIQKPVPPNRKTEVIGMLGSSGFLGMMIGSLLSTAIESSFAGNELAAYRMMFFSSMGMGITYLILAIMACWDDKHAPHSHTPWLFPLLVRHAQVSSLMLAMLMGCTFAITFVHFPKFSKGMELMGDGYYYTAYAISAFIIRLLTRNLSKSLGRHRMVELGFAGFATGFLILPFVSQSWHFLIPGIACGFGHALLFPSVVSLVAGTFPAQFRGTGTTVALGFVDLGTVIFAPILGWLIDSYDFTTTFYTTATIIIIVMAYYHLTAGQIKDHDIHHHEATENEGRLKNETDNSL